MEEMILYHGSQKSVETPEIRISKYNKDLTKLCRWEDIKSSFLGTGKV